MPAGKVLGITLLYYYSHSTFRGPSPRTKMGPRVSFVNKKHKAYRERCIVIAVLPRVTVIVKMH